MLKLPAFEDGNVVGTVNDIISLGSSWTALQGNTSLIEVSNPARIAPMCVVGEDCAYLSYLSDILQTNLSIFTGYWLQAFNMQSHAKVGDVKVLQVLDRLNPNRNPLQTLSYTKEAKINHFSQKVLPYISCEANTYRAGLPMRSNRLALEAAAEINDVSVDAREFTALKEASNLGVGKDIQVSIDLPDNKRFRFMVNISLMVNLIPPQLMTAIFSKNARDLTIRERTYQYKAGRIGLSDLFFGLDLIREERNALIRDKSGVYTEIKSRANKNRLSGVISGNPSVAASSNIYVISSENAKEIENKHHGQLKDPRFREALFEDTYAMLMCVVHQDAERVTFYHRSISASQSVSVKDLKSISKGGGPDISEVLRAYTLSTAPTL